MIEFFDKQFTINKHLNNKHVLSEIMNYNYSLSYIETEYINNIVLYIYY